jgi:hypothetical protein
MKTVKKRKRAVPVSFEADYSIFKVIHKDPFRAPSSRKEIIGGSTSRKLFSQQKRTPKKKGKDRDKEEDKEDNSEPMQF